MKANYKLYSFAIIMITLFWLTGCGGGGALKDTFIWLPDNNENNGGVTPTIINAPIQATTIRSSLISEPTIENKITASNEKLNVAVIVPANTFDSPTTVSIGEVTSPIPNKDGIAPSSLTQVIPPISIKIEGSSTAPNSPIYLNVPLSKISSAAGKLLAVSSNPTSNLVATYYNGKEVKYLAGKTAGNDFRIIIPPDFVMAGTTPATGNSTLWAVSVYICDKVVSFVEGPNFIRTITGSIENPNEIIGILVPNKPNVLLIHGIFSQTKNLGNPSEPDSLKNFLLGKGYNVLTFNYNFWESNIDNGAILALQIKGKEIGQNIPLTIVAHSNGGLVSREALRYLVNPEGSNPEYVKRIIFLSTPNRGAKFCGASLGNIVNVLNDLFVCNTGINGYIISSDLEKFPSNGCGILQYNAPQNSDRNLSEFKV